MQLQEQYRVAEELAQIAASQGMPKADHHFNEQCAVMRRNGLPLAQEEALAIKDRYQRLTIIGMEM